MNNESTELRVPLFYEGEKSKNYELYICGNEPDDTFGKALKRYTDEIGLTSGQIAELTGISRSGIYYYYRDLRKIGYEYLILLCVALRLHPMRQEYLFGFTPHKLRLSDPRYYIFKSFLTNCAFMEKYTVKALNEKLRAENKEPLVSKKRKSDNE
jgi:transcriptional regulator with XRE-family HTH domain